MRLHTGHISWAKLGCLSLLILQVVSGKPFCFCDSFIVSIVTDINQEYAPAGATIQSGSQYFIQLKRRPKACKAKGKPKPKPSRSGNDGNFRRILNNRSHSFYVVYLGTYNRTCRAGNSKTSYGTSAGPALLSTKAGKQWMQFSLKVLNSESAADNGINVSISNYYPPSGKGSKPL